MDALSSRIHFILVSIDLRMSTALASILEAHAIKVNAHPSVRVSHGVTMRIY